MAVVLTGFAVLVATVFNLITDLVGGIRVSVLEEEVRTRRRRGIEQALYAPDATGPVAAGPFDDLDGDAATTVAASGSPDAANAG